MTPEPETGVEYVFGYGSLVSMREPLLVAGELYEPVTARLRGFRRVWGVAMENLDAAPAEKHYVDPGSGRAPDARVAFLDLEPRTGEAVNGLAVPVDATRRAALDAREVNYRRLDVSALFEPRLPGRTYTFLGTDRARARCRVPPEAPELCVSAGYVEAVRDAFAALGADSLAEFDATTDPPPFPVRPLDLVIPGEPASEG